MMCYRPTLPLVALLFAVTGELWAQGEKEIEPAPVVIQYVTDFETVADQPKVALDRGWVTACKNIGKAISVNNGLYSYGFAHGFSCSKKLVTAKELDKRIKSGWLLVLFDEKDRVDLVLYYKGSKAKKLNEVSRTVIPASEYTLQIFRDREITKLITADLLNRTKVTRLVNLTENDRYLVSDNQQDIQDLKVPPPQRFTIAKVQVNPHGQFEVTDIGTADLVKKSHKKASKAAKKGESSDGDSAAADQSAEKSADKNTDQSAEKSTDQLMWKIKLTESVDKLAMYWAYNPDEIKSMRGAIRDALTAKLTPMSLSWSQATIGHSVAFAAGTIGMRYGYSIMQGEPLFTKASMVSVFFEFRKKLLDGFRLYYDNGPMAKVKDKYGKEFHLTWSRPSISKGFALNFDGIIDRVDIAPRIGVMNFDGVIPTPSEFQSNVKIANPFVVKNAGSLGVDIGVESHSFQVLTRLWGGYDFAGLSSGNTYSSMRAGLDFYYDLLDFRRSDLSLLLFGLVEKVTLGRKVDSNEVTPISSDRLVSQLSYNIGFAGMGLTLSW